LKLSVSILLALLAFPAYGQFQNGDIVFQISSSSQSKAIQLATHSRYSHMGIIYLVKDKIYVYEAVQPVRLTPINEWVESGVNGHYVLKRLRNASKLLSFKVLKKMKDVGRTFKGKDYDSFFGWSDDRIYCSELVWKIYDRAAHIRIGNPKKLKDFDLTSPLVRTSLIKRYGRKVPMNETVISPGDMFTSPGLVTVYSN
jgi:hypothetical protein